MKWDGTGNRVVAEADREVKITQDQKKNKGPTLSGGIQDPLHLWEGDRTSKGNGCVQFQQKHSAKHSPEAKEPSDIRDTALIMSIKVVIDVDQRLEKLPQHFFFRMQK